MSGPGPSASPRPSRAGSTLDRVDVRGFTPLIRAARNGDFDAVERLLDAGADPDRRRTGADGWPPLMHAMHAERWVVAELLLARGADPDASGQGGLTPLMMAASDGDVAMIRLLLEHGADPGARLFLGFTAVDYALAHGHPEAARVLRARLEEGPPRAGREGGGSDGGRRARFAREMALWLAWAAGSAELVSLLQS